MPITPGITTSSQSVKKDIKLVRPKEPVSLDKVLKASSHVQNEYKQAALNQVKAKDTAKKTHLFSGLYDWRVGHR